MLKGLCFPGGGWRILEAWHRNRVRSTSSGGWGMARHMDSAQSAHDEMIPVYSPRLLAYALSWMISRSSRQPLRCGKSEVEHVEHDNATIHC